MPTFTLKRFSGLTCLPFVALYSWQLFTCFRSQLIQRFVLFYRRFHSIFGHTLCVSLLFSFLRSRSLMYSCQLVQKLDIVHDERFVLFFNLWPRLVIRVCSYLFDSLSPPFLSWWRPVCFSSHHSWWLVSLFIHLPPLSSDCHFCNFVSILSNCLLSLVLSSPFCG